LATVGRTKTELSAPEYAILGLLHLEPAHGYRIAQRFAPGQDLSAACPMDQSTVYALLHGLEQQGLIDGQQESAGQRPPRTVFHLTPAGQVALDAWLGEPAAPLHRMRKDLLLKLFFIGSQSAGEAERLLNMQIGVCEQYAQALDTEVELLDPRSLERLMAESKRAALGGVIAWLRSDRRRVGAESLPY
jgi:DNA-binding PadR family transcriptional regulator